MAAPRDFGEPGSTNRPADPAAGEVVFTVSQLTAGIKELLEAGFPSVWVAGEISNFARPASGHCYFTLKDDAAQIRAVAWRATAQRIPFRMQDGLEVVCCGRLDVYAPRGSYQLVVEQMLPRGLGALELALRQLRDALAAEGLFRPERKRPLPAFPRRVAFVTSPTGAAIHDFLEVLRRRHHGIEVLVIPVRVQGTGAAAEIAAGIALANRLPLPIDVLIVGRGGGSLEDLWAFNEEIVVRAIAASRLPVVSAVGHEIDVTLSDLAADVRALTPSEAAERIAPSLETIQDTLRMQRERLLAALRSRTEHARRTLEAFASRRAFRRPYDRIREWELRLDELEGRGGRAVRRCAGAARDSTGMLAARLDALSPLGVLSRGYSLTLRARDGAVLRSADEVAPGDLIRSRLAAGELVSRVDEVRE